MNSWIAKIETKRFILVTGKGGTGKSVVAAALAMQLAKRGRKILLAEMGRPRDRVFMRLNELIGVPKLSHKPTLVKNPIDSKSKFLASRILPSEALVEYVALKLKSRKLAGLVASNRITATFLETVPGLSDIVCLGKLWHLLEGEQEEEIDTVILDAPASGHALALLHSPENFAILAKAGPLFHDAEAMRKFFADPKKSKVAFCSLPEEVPFEEAEEFVQGLAGEFQAPLMLVNKCYPLAFKEMPKEGSLALGKLDPAWQYSLNRIEAETAEMRRYKAQFSESVFLPFVFPGSNGTEPAIELALSWKETK